MMTSAPELQGTFETILSPRGCAPGLKIGTGAARGVKLGGSADFQSISIAQNRCKPRGIFGARLCAQHQPQHGRDSNALRLGLRPQPRSILVAAWPRCAVSQDAILQDCALAGRLNTAKALPICNRRYGRLAICATLNRYRRGATLEAF